MSYPITANAAAVTFLALTGHGAVIKDVAAVNAIVSV
jgi:hypothetical protein